MLFEAHPHVPYTNTCAGGFVSDWCAKYWGMRGRLWWLWICMSLGAVFCIALGKTENSFAQTMAIVVVFSIFIQVRSSQHFTVCGFEGFAGSHCLSSCVAACKNYSSISYWVPRQLTFYCLQATLTTISMPGMRMQKLCCSFTTGHLRRRVRHRAIRVAPLAGPHLRLRRRWRQLRRRPYTGAIAEL